MTNKYEIIMGEQKILSPLTFDWDWFFEEDPPYRRIVYCETEAETKDFISRARQVLRTKQSPHRYPVWNGPWWNAESKGIFFFPEECRFTNLVPKARKDLVYWRHYMGDQS